MFETLLGRRNSGPVPTGGVVDFDKKHHIHQTLFHILMKKWKTQKKKLLEKARAVDLLRAGSYVPLTTVVDTLY